MRPLATSLLIACAAVSLAQIPVNGWQLQDAQKVTENGKAISQANYQPKNWYKATVPGTILTSLVNDGVYPEPLYGENNRTIPESLCRTPYWYRTVVPIPAKFGGRHVWLNFEGINYEAHVWVNGHEEGSIKGAFTRGNFDISADVKPGQPAAIAVQIMPPPHPYVPHEHTMKAGTGGNGGAMGADGPTFVATVGWDWIPAIRDRDMGLWQGVNLTATGPVTVEDPHVTIANVPTLIDSTAKVGVESTLRNLTDQPQKGIMLIEIGGITYKSNPFELAPGQVKEDSQTFHIAQPKLWWPNGYGPQNLYKLKVTTRVEGKVSDTAERSFGIREITYLRDGTNKLKVVVNGVPIFCKGGNWGMDEAMKRSPRERLEAQIRLHRDANCTMIRNWVGMATQEDFYDLCDKYGILIWDDFWLANPVDGPNPLDEDLFLANAKEKILRYRNHPSIALWCGRNEGNPPENINKGLADLVSNLDWTRFYQPHSSNYNGVGGGGPYSYQTPSTYYRFSDAFHTEVGAPSIPTLEAIKAMMPEKDWWPINDDWAEHDFLRGAQGGDRYPTTLAHLYGEVTGLEDFVRKGQLMNYESYRGMFEGRNTKLFAPATGVLLWMSNPSQPSFVWQLYTHDLEPNAAMFGTQKACEPIHIQMSPVDGAVQVINNTPAKLTGLEAKVEFLNLDGKLVQVGEARLDAPASAATEALAVMPPGDGLTKTYFVRLTLQDRMGKTISENLYWKSVTKDTPDYSALASLPSVHLQVASHREAAARGTFKQTVTLTNPTKTVAFMAHVQLRKAKSNERVLPVYYSENYVTIFPGESKTITIGAADKDLGGEPAKVFVDGFNVN